MNLKIRTMSSKLEKILTMRAGEFILTEIPSERTEIDRKTLNFLKRYFGKNGEKIINYIPKERRVYD